MSSNTIITNIFSITVAVFIVSYFLKPPPPKSKLQTLFEAFENDQFCCKEQHQEGTHGDGQSVGHASTGSREDGDSGYYTETEGGTGSHFA